MASITNDPPGPSSENQSITEVIIRLAATHVFGVCLYGHLGTLANVPSGVHVINVLAFLLHPSLIAGQIFLGVVRAVQYYYHDRRRDDTHERAGLQFYLDGILGAWAKPSPPRDDTNNITLGPPEESSSSPLPLFKIDHCRLRRVTSPDPVSWAWFGRLFVCLFLVTQAIGTCVVFVRRQEHGCGLFIDLTLGMMAFASAVTGTAVLYLHVTRTVWVVSNEPPPPSSATTGVKRLQRERFYLIDDLFTCVMISEVMNLPIRGSMILAFLGYRSPLVMYNPGVISGWLLYPLLVFGYTYTCRYSRNLSISGLPSSQTRVLSVRFLTRLLGVSLISVLIQEIIGFWVISIGNLYTTKQGCWKDPLSDILFVI